MAVASVTVVFIALSALGVLAPRSPWFLNLRALVDAALIAGLSFGIYKRSRPSAAILFLYFFLTKIVYAYSEALGCVAIMAAVGFTVLFFHGIRGTFAIHRLAKAYIGGSIPAGNEEGVKSA
ncbi:MAG: hypothetical protein V3U74_01900 [Thermodesulfobacteriota bacterium]